MPKQRVPLSQMSPDALEHWLYTTRTALFKKMERERNYLAHRARRGRRTPTDEAYENDLVLEADLMALLDEMLDTIHTNRQDEE